MLIGTRARCRTDPSLGYADYFAAPGSGGGVTLVPEVDASGEHEIMYGGGVRLHHHQSGAEMVGARGFVAQSKPAALDVDGSSTISFFRGEHRQQMGQAPLSLSLHGPPDTASSSFMLHHHQQLGGGGEPREQPAAWQVQGQGAGGWHLRGSRFLLPTQQLLQEFCSIPVDKAPKRPPAQEEQGGGGGSSSSAASWPPSSTQIQSMDAAELQRLKAKLYTMLEEVIHHHTTSIPQPIDHGRNNEHTTVTSFLEITKECCRRVEVAVPLWLAQGGFLGQAQWG